MDSLRIENLFFLITSLDLKTLFGRYIFQAFYSAAVSVQAHNSKSNNYFLRKSLGTRWRTHYPIPILSSLYQKSATVYLF